MSHPTVASTMLDGQELGLVRKFPVKLVLPSEKASFLELSQLIGSLLSIQPSPREAEPLCLESSGEAQLWLQVGSWGPGPGSAAGGLQLCWAPA